MRNMSKNRPKGPRNAPRTRTSERVTTAEGVYANNYFMHAATSQVGSTVKLETIQGGTYEGIFKTFSQGFDVVLELAHKIDNNDPHKIDAKGVVDNLIFHAKDIVYMCAQSVDLNYAVKDSFIDSGISKYNGEICGEKTLEPFILPGNGEECDLNNSLSNQNGWDVRDMFEVNEKLGVGSTYNEDLPEYTVPLDKRNTKDFKEVEAKADQIAKEIEGSQSSKERASLENGESEEAMFAAVERPDEAKRSEGAKKSDDLKRPEDGRSEDGKYVPPPKRKPNPSRNGGGGNNPRGNYTPNGNQRPYVHGNPGNQQMSNSTAASKYHPQAPPPYHQQAHGTHSQSSMRENSNRSSPENKNAPMCPTAVTQPQNIPPYPGNVHQQRHYAQNVVPVTNHSSNVPMQQQKSQRTSPISVPALPNGNADYQAKQMPPVSQQPTHHYHHQSQQVQSGVNMANTQQRKHHPHHSNTRGREDQISELKKFGTDFNLSYDMKNKEAEIPKQIQVVNNRNKSPPTMQQPPPSGERNVLTIVPTQSKHAASTPNSQQPMPSSQPPTTHAAAVSPANMASAAIPTTQVGMKPQHPAHVMPQQPQPPYQPNHPAPLHLPPRDQVLITQHLAQAQLSPAVQSHPSLPQRTLIPDKQQPKQSHQMHMQPPSPAQTSVPSMPQHAGQQNKAVITQTPPNVQNVHTQNVMSPSQHQPPSSQSVAQNAQQSNSSCVQQRSPPQSQNIKNAGQTNQSHSLSPSPTASEHGSSEADGNAKNASKEHDEELDDVTSTLKKSTLNPNAKEFVYNPAPKSFTPLSRSPSTPTQSRPHTPQTPNVTIQPAATGIQVVMPTYIIPQPYVSSAPQPRTSNIRKVPVGPPHPHRTDYHPSNMQVAAATGQPLLAPSVTLAQSPIAHGQPYTVQGYPPHHHLATAQPYPFQIRMVPQQGGGMVQALVPSTMYHDATGAAATTMYVNHSSGTVAMAPHTPHVHHPQQHPPPSTAPSPSQTPQGPSQSHTPNSYQQPPMATQTAPPYPSVMCLQAPPPHGPPHHMVATQAQQHAMQFLQHPQVAHQQSHVQVSLIPYSCS